MPLRVSYKLLKALEEISQKSHASEAKSPALVGTHKRTSWWISQKESTESSNEKEMMNEEVGSEVVFVPGCMLCQCFSGAHPLLTRSSYFAKI